MSEIPTFPRVVFGQPLLLARGAGHRPAPRRPGGGAGGARSQDPGHHQPRRRGRDTPPGDPARRGCHPGGCNPLGPATNGRESYRLPHVCAGRASQLAATGPGRRLAGRHDGSAGAGARSPPPPPAAPARTWCHWIQDVHPEIGLALSGSRLLSAASSPWRHWRDAAWRQAGACVAISRDMAVLVAEHGVDPARIRTDSQLGPGRREPRHPGPRDENSLRHEWGLDGNFVSPTPAIWDGCTRSSPCWPPPPSCAMKPDLIFLFIGDGPQRQALEVQAGASLRTCASCRRSPGHSWPRASRRDVHLVTLRAGCERASSRANSMASSRWPVRSSTLARRNVNWRTRCGPAAPASSSMPGSRRRWRPPCASSGMDARPAECHGRRGGRLGPPHRRTAGRPRSLGGGLDGRVVGTRKTRALPAPSELAARTTAPT